MIKSGETLPTKCLLDKIPNYTYAVNHDRFAKFLSMVISQQPNSYDELEDFMYV